MKTVDWEVISQVKRKLKQSNSPIHVITWANMVDKIEEKKLIEIYNHSHSTCLHVFFVACEYIQWEIEKWLSFLDCYRFNRSIAQLISQHVIC